MWVCHISDTVGGPSTDSSADVASTIRRAGGGRDGGDGSCRWLRSDATRSTVNAARGLRSRLDIDMQLGLLRDTQACLELSETTVRNIAFISLIV